MLLIETVFLYLEVSYTASWQNHPWLEFLYLLLATKLTGRKLFQSNRWWVNCEFRTRRVFNKIIWYTICLDGKPFLYFVFWHIFFSSLVVVFRDLKSITGREVGCYMISCKDSVNIDLVIDWLIKHSKTPNWSYDVICMPCFLVWLRMKVEGLSRPEAWLLILVCAYTHYIYFVAFMHQKVLCKVVTHE